MGRRFYTIIVLLCAFYLPAWSGCGESRPATAPVSGRVTYQGKPVPDGQIMFHPAHGRPAMGAIGPDGGFTLTTFKPGDGALLGHHRVTIEATRVTGDFPTEDLKGKGKRLDVGTVSDKPLTVEWLVPEIYSRLQTTPLTAEVKSGENTVTFDLPVGSGRPTP